MGFYLAQFFLNIPFENDLAFALPSYIVAVLGATFLLKRVLERVQRANARRFAEAIVQRTRVEQLLERLIHAQEDERKRLSLELHDSPIQWLTSGVYRLEACLGFFERGDYARVNQELEQVRQVLDTTLTELRHTAAALHPPELEKVGLVKSLERYANSFEQDTGIRCQFKEDGSIPRMEAATELGIYRVLQEALSNVRKHSRATSVLMEISLRRGAILASVGDNGIGFDMNDRRATGSAHLGIAGMEERARMLADGEAGQQQDDTGLRQRHLRQVQAPGIHYGGRSRLLCGASRHHTRNDLGLDYGRRVLSSRRHGRRRDPPGLLGV